MPRRAASHSDCPEARATTLIQAHDLVVLIPHLTRVDDLSRVDKEVGDARARLLGEQHERRCAVTPDDEENIEEHAPVLLLEGAADRIAKSLMGAGRKEVRTLPTLAVKDEPHVEAGVHTRHQGLTSINTESNLMMLAFVLITASGSELAAAYGNRLSMFAGEEAVQLGELNDRPDERRELVGYQLRPLDVDILSRPVAAHGRRLWHLQRVGVSR